jgi:hypothetical protein
LSCGRSVRGAAAARGEHARGREGAGVRGFDFEIQSVLRWVVHEMRGRHGM